MLDVDAEAAECPATKRVLELWTLMLERPEIWRVSDGDVSCMLELRELATAEEMRGRGVGLQLALAAREVAADVGAPAYKIDCTSQYRFEFGAGTRVPTSCRRAHTPVSTNTSCFVLCKARLGCFSSKIAEKIGMKKVFSVQYASLLGESGKPIFQPPRPHVEVGVRGPCPVLTQRGRHVLKRYLRRRPSTLKNSVRTASTNSEANFEERRTPAQAR